MLSYSRISLALCALMLSACASTSLDDKNSGLNAPAAPHAATGADTRQVHGMQADTTAPGAVPAELMAKRSVYFDFDSTILRADATPVIEAHAKYLRSNPTRKVFIEGNTDERGGREYNLALGQRRAESVRRGLSLLGVPANQMESVSFGEEKPKATGEDEASWAQNRRADLNYR